MKIPSINLRERNTIYNNEKVTKSPSFCATAKVVQPPSKAIDWVLKNKVAQGAFKFASQNSFGYTTLVLAISCMIFRPITIMALPGQKKEDKQYLSMKSIIASMIATAGRLLIIIPFGLALMSKGKNAKNELENSAKKLGEHAKAVEDKIPFPAKGTTKFESFNFTTNNVFSAFLAIGTAALMPGLITKAMSKIAPQDNKKSGNPPKTKVEKGGS